MENQHEKIEGYRDLNQEEVDLMNEIKSMGNECGKLIEKLRAGSTGGYDVEQRWLSIGQTHLQQGFMALTRSVARPDSF